MLLTPGLSIFILTAIALTASVLAQPTHDASAMERSREMRRDIQGGDVRHLTHLSQQQQNSHARPRIIQAPPMRGDPTIRIYASPQRVVQASTVIGPGHREADPRINPVTRGDDSRLASDDNGWTSIRQFRHESSFVTGYGGYFHPRRYDHGPMILVRYRDPYFYGHTAPSRITHDHRPCARPVVVCPAQRPWGFSFFIQF